MEFGNYSREYNSLNITVDVDTDEIKTQAAKFGNTVDKDGRPPTLSKKVKGSSTCTNLAPLFCRYSRPEPSASSAGAA